MCICAATPADWNLPTDGRWSCSERISYGNPFSTRYWPMPMFWPVVLILILVLVLVLPAKTIRNNNRNNNNDGDSVPWLPVSFTTP